MFILVLHFMYMWSNLKFSMNFRRASSHSGTNRRVVVICACLYDGVGMHIFVCVRFCACTFMCFCEFVFCLICAYWWVCWCKFVQIIMYVCMEGSVCVMWMFLIVYVLKHQKTSDVRFAEFKLTTIQIEVIDATYGIHFSPFYISRYVWVETSNLL
jgi:hypothetical protein